MEMINPELEALIALEEIKQYMFGGVKDFTKQFGIIENALKKQITDARRIENLELIKDIVSITYYRNIGNNLWAIELSGVDKVTYKELLAIKGEYNR